MRAAVIGEPQTLHAVQHHGVRLDAVGPAVNGRRDLGLEPRSVSAKRLVAAEKVAASRSGMSLTKLSLPPSSQKNRPSRLSASLADG
jgi:hypothetical protein